MSTPKIEPVYSREKIKDPQSRNLSESSADRMMFLIDVVLEHKYTNENLTALFLSRLQDIICPYCSIAELEYRDVELDREQKMNDELRDYIGKEIR